MPVEFVLMIEWVEWQRLQVAPGTAYRALQTPLARAASSSSEALRSTERLAKSTPRAAMSHENVSRPTGSANRESRRRDKIEGLESRQGRLGTTIEVRDFNTRASDLRESDYWTINNSRTTPLFVNSPMIVSCPV